MGKKIWSFTCIVLATVFASLLFLSIGAVHVPIDSKPVLLPLGEQNRIEKQWPVGRADPYVEVRNMSVSALPETAWCEESGWQSDLYLGLRCAWPVHDGVVKFQIAFVSIDLPSKDVSWWTFQRENLTAVPKTENWLHANFVYLVGAALSLLFALCLLYFVFILYFKLPQQQSENY